MKSPQTDYYENNVSLLKKNHPAVWTVIENEQPVPLGEVQVAKNGLKNIRTTNQDGKEFFLHHQENPLAEVDQFLDMIPEDSFGVVVMVGMGLGYAPLALLKERKIQYLAVFEPELGIFMQALCNMDLEPILSDPRFLLGVGPNLDVSQIMMLTKAVLQLENVHTLKHLPSFSINQESYSHLQAKVFDHVNKCNVEGSTNMLFGKNFLQNRLQQITSIHHDFLLESLGNAFKDVPAILVAGGPSLNKNIHLIKKAQEKAIIIAIDSALPALLENNVTPHFVTTIDPESITFEKLASVAPKAINTSLICMPWVTPKIPKKFPAKNVFWCFAATAVETWINNLLGGHILTTGCGTVAQLSFQAATILGCSPIIFVGQDLALAESESHAQHVFLTNDSSLTQNEDTLYVKGFYGGEVPTNRAFMMMLRHFESMIAVHPKPVINSTEGGAHIEGTEPLALEQSLNLHCKAPQNITTILENTNQKTSQCKPAALLSEFKKARKDIAQTYKLLTKSEKQSQKLLAKIQQLEDSKKPYLVFSALPLAVQKMLTHLDELNVQLDNKRNLWHLLESMTRAGVRQLKRLKVELEQLTNQPERYLEWLSKSVQRLIFINDEREQALNFLDEQLASIITFHKTEKKLAADLKTSKSSPDSLLKLSRFYCESGHLRLAQPHLKSLAQMTPDSAEVHFYLGCTAATHSDYANADNFFSKASLLDSTFNSKIDAFRQQLGDEYMNYAEAYRSLDKNTFTKLLIKGFQGCPTHEKITLELYKVFLYDLNKMKIATQTEEKEKLINAWMTLFLKHDKLKECFPNKPLAELFKYHGKLHAWKNDIATTQQSLTTSLAYFPDDPEAHAEMMSVMFAQGVFAKGISHLNMAIALDKSYAEHWERIGDELRTAGNDNDAISAYEQCLIQLPDNLYLLKKMAECYSDLGQLEAAHEALQQLKYRLTNTSEENQEGTLLSDTA